MIIKRAYVDPSSVFFRSFLFSFLFFEAIHKTKMNKVKKEKKNSLIQSKIYIYKSVNGTKIYGQ